MAGLIKPIDNRSVHQICSGQVVVTLAVAVKELIENSLDADATIIDVRLKEYGSELVEVVDNGIGVEEENFESLALKHCTSKLKDFSDLAAVETYGFRGEALSSLCALSDVTITTCHSDSSSGFRLDFNHDGVLIQKVPCARQVGTTVTVKNLFVTLPVRHKDFLRNLRREFTKTVHLLTAYCLVCPNVRIGCINQTAGRKTKILTTRGSSTTRESIVSIYGSKQFSTLLELKTVAPTPCVQEEYNLPIEDTLCSSIPFDISGFISSCEHGKGRNACDRQFFFINDRPCDLPKVSRLINDVYHLYNRHQYPFISLNISLKKDAVDVNVTPDKRSIFMQHEKLLLATLKSSLLQLFEPLPAMIQKNDLFGCKITKLEGNPTSSFREGQGKRKLPDVDSDDGGEDYFEPSCEQLEVQDDDKCLLTGIIPRDSSQLPKEKQIFSTTSTERKETHEKDRVGAQKCTRTKTATLSEVTPLAKLLRFQRNSRLDSGVLQVDSKSAAPKKSKLVSIKDYCVPSERKDVPENDRTENIASQKIANDCVEEVFEVSESEEDISMPVDELKNTNNIDDKLFNSRILASSSDQLESNEEIDIDGDMGISVAENSFEEPCRPEDEPASGNDSSVPEELSDSVVDEPGSSRAKATVVVPFSFEDLEKEMANTAEEKSREEALHRLFRAKIDPTDNKSAEDELRKELTKDMFSKMEVIGQFNLGFIIAKLGSDLFIVDQHATDEKYNYEMLQRNTVLETQKLVIPQTLQLTVVNESILLENKDIFNKNGFHFNINETSPGQRVQLVSVPVSRNWTFGKDDIDELIFMLSDSPGVMCRPSRVSQMFASRACRKSVMIGTALSHADMKKLLVHMGEIEQPWNCPHGRPTIRHLINLDMLIAMPI